MSQLRTAGLAAGLLLAAPAFARENPGPAFTLDLAPLQRVPEHWRTWTELAPLRTNLAGLAAIAVASDGRFAIVAGRTLWRGRLGDGAGRDVRAELPETGRAATFLRDGTLLVALDRTWLEFSADGRDPTEGPTLSSSSRITSIAATTGHVWLADVGERLVWVFDRSGALRAQIRGAESHGFVLPSPHFDVAPAGPDRAWIVNPGELRVELWTVEGIRQRHWGQPGMNIERFCGCCNPTDITVLPDGSIVTAEKGVVRVKVHRADGALESVVAAPEQFAADTVGLDLAADAVGRLYVADPVRRAVRVFEQRRASDRP